MNVRENLVKLACQQSSLLMKVDDYLQALGIIVKKEVDIDALSRSDDVEDYNSRWISVSYSLTECEFDLVTKVVREIKINELNERANGINSK